MPIHSGYTPPKKQREKPPTEHRCPNCYTPGFGVSSIACKNDPTVDPLARAKAFLAKRREMQENEGIV